MFKLRAARLETVTVGPLTDAEDASARLQEGIRIGLPVMIPGAWEVRVRRPVVQQPDLRDVRAISPAVGMPETREQLERTREGGGAPGERTGRSNTILARLWHAFAHPAHAIVV
jgi:hypothetical protein